MEHASTAGVTAMPVPEDAAPAAPQAGMAEPPAAAASAPSIMPGMAKMTPSAVAQGIPIRGREQTSTNRPVTRAEYSVARMAYKEEMRLNRLALIAAAYEERAKTNAASPGAEPPPGTPVMAAQETPAPAMAAPTGAMAEMGRTTFTAAQRQALEAFANIAAKLSSALAADDLVTANQCVANLPGVLGPLQRAIAPGAPGSESVQRLVKLQWRPSENLAAAREQFLPFSTATVELTKVMRKADPAFAGLKIYHCPMAPKPGLWMQAKGPLANPFYGSKMLRCGEEVAP
jgi:hypothetical protein